MNDHRILLASAARTATTTSPVQDNRHWRGVAVMVNVSELTAGASITVTIQAYNPVSGGTVDLLASAAINSTGEKTPLVVYPGCVAVPNAVLNQPLPWQWLVKVTHADSKSITYSVTATLID
jgi:hypothetical protein